MNNKVPKESGQISRREFIRDAGLVVGGAAVGAGITYPLVPEKEVIKEVEVPGPTVEVEVPTYVCPYCREEFASLSALTSHVETEHPAEAAEIITKYVCPYCGEEFDTLATLKSHVEAEHPAEAVPVVAPANVIKLTVNGYTHELLVKPNWTLHDVIHGKLRLTGAKTFCKRGACGSCTVIMDGRPILSCMALAIECDGKTIETVEGIAEAKHPLIQSYINWDCMQCGYCTPGFVVTAKALLDKNPNPTEDDIRDALAGNLCRCGTYPQHLKAVLEAAKNL